MATRDEIIALSRILTGHHRATSLQREPLPTDQEIEDALAPFVAGGGGGGGAVAVADEGVEKTDAVTELNFVGGGVTVTNTVDDCEITIPGTKVINSADVELTANAASVKFSNDFTLSEPTPDNIVVTPSGKTTMQRFMFTVTAQAGTGVPTVTIVDNTLGKAVTASTVTRLAAGVYACEFTCTGTLWNNEGTIPFPELEVTDEFDSAVGGTVQLSLARSALHEATNKRTLVVITRNPSGTLADDIAVAGSSWSPKVGFWQFPVTG